MHDKKVLNLLVCTLPERALPESRRKPVSVAVDFHLRQKVGQKNPEVRVQGTVKVFRLRRLEAQALEGEGGRVSERCVIGVKRRLSAGQAVDGAERILLMKARMLGTISTC